MKLKILVSAIVSIIIWPASITAQSELIPMIEIPAGNFYMGTLGEDENYDEAPMHKVYISKPFKMGLTEVTNAQYELFCLNTSCCVVKMVFQVKMTKRWCS